MGWREIGSPSRNKVCLQRLAAGLVVGLVVAGVAAASAAWAAEPAAARPADERFWQTIATREPPQTLSLRSLFVFLRNLAEARVIGKVIGN